MKGIRANGGEMADPGGDFGSERARARERERWVGPFGPGEPGSTGVSNSLALLETRTHHTQDSRNAHRTPNTEYATRNTDSGTHQHNGRCNFWTRGWIRSSAASTATLPHGWDSIYLHTLTRASTRYRCLGDMSKAHCVKGSEGGMSILPPARNGEAHR